MWARRVLVCERTLTRIKRNWRRRRIRLNSPLHAAVVPVRVRSSTPPSKTPEREPSTTRLVRDCTRSLRRTPTHYNALQATVGHRFSSGLYFQSAYTYANSIDDVSTASVAFVARINDQNNPRDSRGLSDFAKRHRWVTSAVYQLPSLNQTNKFVKAALGGWQASTVIILQSGSPFTVFDPAGGSAYQLASPSASATFSPGFSCGNAPSSGSTTARLGNWVKAAAYQPNPFAPLSTGGFSDATLYGDTPRNCIIGPPQRNLDFSLGKIFKITEQQNLRFLADFFNLFNHPSFANPAFAAVGPTPGSGSAPITSTIGTPRLIQFSLKYSF